MTTTEAQNILGVSGRQSLKTVRTAYEKKTAQLQLKLRPGMPMQVRSAAYQQLAELTAAWNTLQIFYTAKKRPPARRRAARKTQPRRSAPKAAAHNQRQAASKPPQDLGQAWQQLVDHLGIPEPVFISVLIIIALAVLFSLANQ